jgi:hypothetical protein
MKLANKAAGGMEKGLCTVDHTPHHTGAKPDGYPAESTAFIEKPRSLRTPPLTIGREPLCKTQPTGPPLSI